MESRTSTSYVIQKLGDLVECSICIGLLSKPKTLHPCMHSFCLACLETYARGKQPGEQVSCPVCRVATTVPPGGFRSLPGNHLMENVLELHRISQQERRQTPCDNCTKGSLSGSYSVTGEGGGSGGANGGGYRVDMYFYCVECRMKLCTRCVEAHKRLKIMSNHKVVNLGTEMSQYRQDDTFRKQFIGCSQHPNKSASQFCLTCSRWTCPACMTGSQHKNHEAEDIPHRMKKLRKEIRMDISATRKLLTELQRRMESHVDERNGFVANVRQIEEQINRRVEEVIISVRTQQARLIRQLEALKTERLKELNGQYQEMELVACMLDTFKTFSADVSKRGDADIFQLADEIRNQVQELLHTKHRYLEQVEVRFNHSANNNAGGFSLGDVALFRKKKEAFDDYLTSPVLIDAISGLQSVSGVTALDYRLYIVCNQSHDLHIYHTEPALKAHCRVVLPSSDPQDIAACPKNRCVYVCDYTSSVVAQLNLNGKMTYLWKTKETPGGLSVTEQGTVLVTFPTYRLVREFNPDGIQVRSFSLSKDLDKPWHCVRLRASARLVVCSWHRVGILEENGAIAQVHGSTQGSQPTQFYCPSHLAADDNDVILVADTQNNRLKLVRPSMECRELNTDPQVMKEPRRLHLDLATRLLYVAVSNGNVLVYRIMA